MTESRVIRFIVASARTPLALWRWLGAVDDALARAHVPPDCAYGQATALVADSAIVRTVAAVFDRFNAEGSVAVSAAVAMTHTLERFSRSQIVRIAGITLTTALVVHAALYLVLPSRFGEQLPSIVWIAAGALAAALIAAPRQLVAAWDEWRR